VATPFVPSPLAGLSAGDRVLVRVLALVPPTNDALGAANAVAGATAAAATVAATRATAAGATAATLAAAQTAASAPNSGAAQIQAAAPSAAMARVGQPTSTNPAPQLVQAVSATSAPVAATAVQTPGLNPGVVRAAAGPAITPDPPPVMPTAMPAPAGAATAALAVSAETTAAETTASAAPPASAPPFEATVVGTSTTGQPILLAGQSLLTLRTASAPTGSTLVLQLADAGAAAATESTVSGQAAAPLPSLPELVRAAQTIGGAAQAAVTAAVPQPGPALAAQMLFFVSALQRGDLRLWMGDAARGALERAGRGAAVTKLAGELKRASDDAAPRSDGAGEWRGQTIPLSDGGAIQPIQLFLHRTNPDAEGGARDQAGGRPTRFLFDLELSQLGKIQLDGFAQPPRFDLILRTSRPLSDAIRTDIRQLFADQTSARGITGTVSFQVAPPIVPNAAPPVPRPGILV
jgi:hypothetical protein